MLRTIALIAGLGLMLAPRGAAAFDPADVVEAELLSGWRMENGHHMAALRLNLEPGWKTYWRAPGDAGIPPRFDWDGSGNVATATVHWPVPEIFVVNGLASIGYTGDVVMPIEVRPVTSAEAATLAGTVDIGVCEEICIPVSLKIRADLPVRGAEAGTDVIRRALADRPLTAREAGVGDVTCQTKPISDGVRVTVSMQMPPLSASEAAVIEFSDPSVWISEAVTRREGTQLIASAEMVPANAAPFAVSRQDLRFTVLGDGRAVDIRGCTGG